MVAIDWDLMKSVATDNCLVTNILRNFLFYFQQNKENHTGLEQIQGE